MKLADRFPAIVRNCAVRNARRREARSDIHAQPACGQHLKSTLEVRDVLVVSNGEFFKVEESQPKAAGRPAQIAPNPLIYARGGMCLPV